MSKSEDEVTRCHHCGKLPDADGDHSCPCPYPDDECPDHWMIQTPPPWPPINPETT